MELKLNNPMVDYLTMTFDNHSEDKSRVEDMLSLERVFQIERDGDSAKRRWFGGRVYNGVFAGTGHNNGLLYAMLDAPGYIADVVFCECGEAGLKPGSCTRIDLQITIPRRENLPLVDAHLELEGTEDRKLKIEGNSKDGYTLYIGAPSSDKRIRIYDKKVLSAGKEATFWRFEVQYRREQASSIFQSLAYDGYEAGQFLKGEIEAVKRNPGTTASKILKDFWYSLEGKQGARPKTIHYESNTIAWMREQVEPAIVRLLNSYDYQDRIEMIKLLLQWSVMSEYAAVSMNILPEPPVV